MNIQNLSYFFWNCRRTSNTMLFHVCNSYTQAKKPNLLVIMETHFGPSKLKHIFSRLATLAFPSLKLEVLQVVLPWVGKLGSFKLTL